MAVTILPFPQESEPFRPFSNALGMAKGMQALEEAQTRNKFLPEALRLANELSQLGVGLKQNELNFAPRMSLADLNYRQAQTPHLNASTKSLLEHLKIAQAQEARAKQEFNQENNDILRLMKMPGLAGQMGAQLFLQQLENSGKIPSPRQQIPQANDEGKFTQNILENLPLESPIPNQMGRNVENILSQNIPSPIPTAKKEIPLSELLRNTLESNVEKQNAWAQYNQRRTEGYSFNQLPTDEKKYAVALLKGAGYSGPAAVQKLGRGESLEDLMAIKGYTDPSQYPQPDYAATATALTQSQKRTQAEAELSTMNKIVTQWGKPYSQRFFGYSPKQIINALKGKDKDEQAKAVAFYMVGPDIASVRGRALAGQIGINMMEDLGNKSLVRGKIIEGQIDPEVFEKAQNLVDAVIRKGVRAANRAGYSSKPQTDEELLQEEQDEQLLGGPSANSGLDKETQKQLSSMSDEELIRRLKGG